MIFDLHNLVPSIVQVNALRGNDRYAELPNVESNFGADLTLRKVFQMEWIKKVRGKIVLGLAPQVELELSAEQQSQLEKQGVSLPTEEGAAVAIGDGAFAEPGGVAIGAGARAGRFGVAIGAGAGGGRRPTDK